MVIGMNDHAQLVPTLRVACLLGVTWLSSEVGFGACVFFTAGMASLRLSFPASPLSFPLAFGLPLLTA